MSCKCVTRKKFSDSGKQCACKYYFAVTNILSANTDNLLTSDAYEQLIEREHVHKSAILSISIGNEQSAEIDVIVNADMQVDNSEVQVNVDVGSRDLVHDDDLELQNYANELRKLQRADHTLK